MYHRASTAWSSVWASGTSCAGEYLFLYDILCICIRAYAGAYMCMYNICARTATLSYGNFRQKLFFKRIPQCVKCIFLLSDQLLTRST